MQLLQLKSMNCVRFSKIHNKNNLKTTEYCELPIITQENKGKSIRTMHKREKSKTTRKSKEINTTQNHNDKQL